MFVYFDKTVIGGTLGQSLWVYETKREREEGSVTMPYVDLPLGAFPRYLQLREAVDFSLAVYFTVCCILFAIIFNY